MLSIFNISSFILSFRYSVALLFLELSDVASYIVQTTEEVSLVSNKSQNPLIMYKESTFEGPKILNLADAF
jgi:hypothetical protein